MRGDTTPPPSDATVLVTGVSSGLGRDTAELLVQRGARVFGTVRREEDRLRAKEAGIEALVVDLREPEAVEDLAHRVELRLEETPLDALIHNAGIAPLTTWEDCAERLLRETMEVNFHAPVALTRSLLRPLRKGPGRVVLVSSVNGRIAPPFVGPYAASKFALEAFGESLRRELLPDRIAVSVIAPGPVATPLWDKIGEGPDLWGRWDFAAEGLRRQLREARAHALPSAVVAEEIVRAALDSDPVRRRSPRPPRMRLEMALARLLPGSVLDRLLMRRFGRRK